jgi:RNA-directed DNA polymerase
MLSSIKTLADLATYLGLPVSQLKKIDPASGYITFQIPKPGSNEMRTIEAPQGILKAVLERLADGLQWLYSDHRTPAAQGYIRSTVNDADKRTIFTNATKHLHHDYLLNIDLDNFFHQVTREKAEAIFSDNRFFKCDKATVSILSGLVCYHGRLPMGSPASPPLSNFATYDLDLDLLRWTHHHKIVYTRFVDDLSFSSKQPITPAHFEMISDMLKMHQFNPDPEKIKWYGKNDEKEVTGLLVGKNISLPPGYIRDLEEEIEKMKEIKQYAQMYPDYTVLEWIQKMERITNGRLAFVGSVYGRQSPEYRTLLEKMNEASPPALQSLSWRYAGYEYFAQ